jgi:hypothetical protein
MTEKAPNREALAVIAVGLALGFGWIVLEAIEEMLACPAGKCVTDHAQHLLAFLGTATAALASFRQGKTAKTKSEHHRKLSKDEKEAPLKSAHDYDANHFKNVSVWWYTFFAGAAAAVLAELIDWWVVAGQ